MPTDGLLPDESHPENDLVEDLAPADSEQGSATGGAPSPSTIEASQFAFGSQTSQDLGSSSSTPGSATLHGPIKIT